MPVVSRRFYVGVPFLMYVQPGCARFLLLPTAHKKARKLRVKRKGDDGIRTHESLICNQFP